MYDKDKQRHIAYEALVIMGCLALLLFIIRLWPILLLVILGLFIGLVRLMFLSNQKVDRMEPMPLLLPEPKEPTAQDMEALAFGLAQKRITELVTARYPEARWVWETRSPKEDILAGQPVFILLNKAGGYRKGQVILQNLQVCDVMIPPVVQPPDPNREPETDDDDSQPEIPKEEPLPVNYELIAFEWVEAHILELNGKCNEALAQGREVLLIGSEELPEQGSWQDICTSLLQNGMEKAECQDGGIQIYFKQ